MGRGRCDQLHSSSVCWCSCEKVRTSRRQRLVSGRSDYPESSLVPNVYVIGDACKAEKMPKSGFSANSQGKVTVAAVISLLDGEDPVSPLLANTCCSCVTPDRNISVAAVYCL